MRRNRLARRLVAATLLATSLSSCFHDDDDPAGVSFSTGLLDSSFGTGGKISIPLTDGVPAGLGVGLQSDRKIVIGGLTGPATNFDVGAARFNSDGSLDSTFGAGGKVTTPIGSAADQGNAVAIQSDGKIVVAGQTNTGSGDDFAVVRYTATGGLDGTFGSGGKVITAIGAAGTDDDHSYGIAIQSDGMLVVAGYAHSTVSDNDFSVVRYTTAGVPDGNFNDDGMVTTPIGSGDDQGRALALQSDGKIVVAGYSNNGSNHDFAVVRYTTTGGLDGTFGAGGKVTTPIGSGDDQGEAVALQSDGKIVVAGYSNNGSNHDFAVVRYTATGGLDSTFGTGGKVTTPIGSGNDQAHTIAIQSDGKIVVAGESSNGSNADFAVVRYNSDGTLDATFGSGGKVTTAFGSVDDVGQSIALQPDGKIVVAGYSTDGSNFWLAMARYR